MTAVDELGYRLKQSDLYCSLHKEDFQDTKKVFEKNKELLDQNIHMAVCDSLECLTPFKILINKKNEDDDDDDDEDVLDEDALEYERSMRVETVSESISSGMCSHSEYVEKFLDCRLVHFAAMEDKLLPALKYLQKCGCDMNVETSEDSENMTPLCIAVHQNQIETVKYLLSLKEVDPNKGDTPPLLISMKTGHEDIFKLLLEAEKIDRNGKDSDGVPILNYAVRYHSEFVEPLLKAGASPDVCSNSGATPLISAVAVRNVDMVKLLIKYGADVNKKSTRGIVVILDAVYREDLELCTVLLEAGANPNQQTEDDGHSLLIHAAYDGCLEIIQLLMKHGADATLANKQGYTPIHIAAWNGYVNCVKEFIAAGAPHDQQTSDKNTPLALAAHGGHLAVMEELLTLKCNVNNRDKDSDTALHYASYNGLTKACELLLSQGSDPDMTNRVNTTALWNAVYMSKKEVVKLLLLANVKLEVETRGIDQHAQTDNVVFIYEEPRSPLWVSVDKNNPEIALLLISAGYDLHREQWLVDGEFPGDCDERLRTILTHYVQTPPRLVSRCRNFLRSLFRQQIAEAVSLLPIPDTLKSYLTLSDLQ